MKKLKFIEDHDSKQYKKNLEELQQIINPKPPKEVLEKLLQKYQAEQNAWREKYK
jgi:hypothetical protein